jgi:hypothetical protein
MSKHSKFLTNKYISNDDEWISKAYLNYNEKLNR